MLTKGSTTELRAVAESAHVWLTGAPVRRLNAAWPFVGLRLRPAIQPVDALDLCVIPLGDGSYRVVGPADREMGTGDAATSVRLALTVLND